MFRAQFRAQFLFYIIITNLNNKTAFFTQKERILLPTTQKGAFQLLFKMYPRRDLNPHDREVTGF